MKSEGSFDYIILPICASSDWYVTIFASAPDVILCSRQGDLIFPLCQAVLYNSCDSFKNLYNLRFGFRVVASSVHESVSAVEPLSFSEDVVEAQALDAPRSPESEISISTIQNHVLISLWIIGGARARPRLGVQRVPVAGLSKTTKTNFISGYKIKRTRRF